MCTKLMTPSSVVFMQKDRWIGCPTTRWARVMGSDDVSFSLAVFRKHRWIDHDGHDGLWHEIAELSTNCK